MSRFRILLLGLVLVVSLVALWVTRTASQTVADLIGTPLNVYSVKFLCGEFDKFSQGNRQFEGPVKPGNYQTAINIHNPNLIPVKFVKKAILMFAGPVPVPPTEFEVPKKPGPLIQAGLESDWGMEIDCADIRIVLLQNQVPPQVFIKGWVVIESPSRQPLDVVAAYTAHGFKIEATGPQPEGFALELDRVTPTVVR